MIINDIQKVNLTVEALNAAGNPAPVDGAPVWSTSDPNIVSLVIAPDGFSAVAHSVSLGVATITVTADADLTAGVRAISTAMVIQVVPAEAVSLVLTAGTPVDK
jgi:hypothetical protein